MSAQSVSHYQWVTKTADTVVGTIRMKKVTIRRRDDYERADGRAALYAVLNLERTKIRIPLDIAVTTKEWDAASEHVKGRGKEIQDWNLIIDHTKAKISDILVRARLTDETLTKESFLALYRRPGETMDFNEFADRHLEEIQGGLQPQTIRHHKTALKKLKDFAPALMISEITPDWLRVYAAHLRDIHHNNPGTINKNMCVIRMHFYAAIRAGKTKSNPFESYRLPTSEPDVVYLTEEELQTLTSLYHREELPENEQDSLRFFLFMTFTAMHISDARALQIEQTKNGVIQYRRKKTHTRVSIPMSKPARELVDYYKGQRRRGNLFLKLPTDQGFNRLIKKVCDHAGIDKNVSAKTGRHTFATLYCKRNSGDIATLSKLLGHTSINTTMIYAHIMKEDKVKGVSVFDDML